jgi:predicted nucleic acid-binding Zn ribbon protein
MWRPAPPSNNPARDEPVNHRLRALVMRDFQPFAGHDSRAIDRGVKRAQPVVESLIKKLGLQERVRQSTLSSNWPQIVGDGVAKHAQPVSLRNGTLIVAVDHPVWLQELERYHKALLLQKLQQHLGAQTIRKLIFRIG